jgi:hypothetical protein
MARTEFKIVIDVEADDIAADVLRRALERGPVQRAMRLCLTKALEGTLEALGVGALFINVTGGRLTDV